MENFVVRCLTLGEEMWKMLTNRRLNVWKPRVGDKWLDTPCWAFIKELNMKIPHNMDNALVQSVMKA